MLYHCSKFDLLLSSAQSPAFKGKAFLYQFNALDSPNGEQIVALFVLSNFNALGNGKHNQNSVGKRRR
jgi:hypothetical protein